MSAFLLYSENTGAQRSIANAARGKKRLGFAKMEK
jgi:hypothetical protein